MRSTFQTCTCWMLCLMSLSCGLGERHAERLGGEADSVQTALAAARQSLERDPGSQEARLRLLGLLLDAGQAQEGLKTAEEGLRADALSIQMWNMKASSQLMLRDSASAMASLRRSLDIDPNQPVVVIELAMIEAERGSTAAISMADSMLNSSGDPQIKTRARLLKARCLAVRGERDSAFKAYDDCITNDYTCTEAYLRKGVLHCAGDDHAKALSTFAMAGRVDVSNPEVFYLSGRCLAHLGRNTEAVEAYRKARGIDGTHGPSKEALLALGFSE